MKNLHNEIVKVLEYFHFFNYAPNSGEIFTFLTKKIHERRLEGILSQMVEKGIITSHKIVHNSEFKIHNSIRYTLGEYDTLSRRSKMAIEQYSHKYLISQKKLQNILFCLYIKLLSFFPQIQLIGLSGSVAMMNVDKNDDIDLFIITAKNRLWSARLICLLFAQLLGLRRKRLTAQAKDKICLNLFFDGRNLAVPRYKQTEYVAHEVLQMKPKINKNYTYEKFLNANSWVFNVFPNAKEELSIKNQVSRKKILNSKYLILNTLADKVEKLLKSLQLYFINRHRIKEIITDTQLWFHPEDFGEKIKVEYVKGERGHHLSVPE